MQICVNTYDSLRRHVLAAARVETTPYIAFFLDFHLHFLRYYLCELNTHIFKTLNLISFRKNFSNYSISAPASIL